MSAARPPAPRRPSRRAVLAGAGALALSACTGGGSAPVDPTPRLTADQRLATRAADEVQALVELYAATTARHPALRGELTPLGAEHVAHRRALLALLPAAPSPSATSSGSSSAGGTPSPSATPPPAVPATAVAARVAVVRAERAAAVRRRAQAGRAGAELARLLASIAASESVHASLLGAG